MLHRFLACFIRGIPFRSNKLFRWIAFICFLYCVHNKKLFQSAIKTIRWRYLPASTYMLTIRARATFNIDSPCPVVDTAAVNNRSLNYWDNILKFDKAVLRITTQEVDPSEGRWTFRYNKLWTYLNKQFLSEFVSDSKYRGFFKLLLFGGKEIKYWNNRNCNLWTNRWKMNLNLSNFTWLVVSIPSSSYYWRIRNSAWFLSIKASGRGRTS